MKTKRVIISIFLCILILAAGVGFMRYLIMSRPHPVKQAKTYNGALVQSLTVTKTTANTIIHATGTVQAARQATLSPQISGMVVSVAPLLDDGSLFNKGDLLFSIEDTDYRLAEEQARAAVTKAESAMVQLESKALVAREEWYRMTGNKETSPNPLVVYEPQLKEARAALNAATATLEQAKVNFSRTKIRAPFNCRILSEDVAVGQFMKSGNKAITIIGADKLEIIVPIELYNLQWLTIDPQHGSKVTVSKSINGMSLKWQGRASRLLSDVDSKGRMARVVISLDNPYSGNKIPPLIGMFVDVSIEGGDIENIIILPRHAVREGSTVWRINDDNKLSITEVHILRFEKDTAWIDKGLEEGDRIVLTTLSGVADGMKVRTREDTP